MNKTLPATVFCIDGSGNKDRKAADRKRPIYRLDVADGRISRPILTVGESALEFFVRHEVLLPLRREFRQRLAVWPFEPTHQAEVIIAECYPAACQRQVFKRSIAKRQPLAVAAALTNLHEDAERSRGVPPETWIHAASSEDEFDMFTTAFALRELLATGRDIFSHPADATITTIEGWILGLGYAETPNQHLYNGRSTVTDRSRLSRG